MKINIYYGGRGILDDPTLYVINVMQKVLEELHVTVERFNLYNMKNEITVLPQSLKDADGIILASTVEWYGIGGYMQQFLDACWLYGDKEKISRTYMCPVVMSTTYGEREGKLNLATAWEILGGLPCSGLCGYIADITTLEMQTEYQRIIEKKAENMYRTISQKMASFPASNQAVKQKVATTKSFDLTPQETEQLSQYAADDAYVQTQKEDIRELTSLFRNMMGDSEPQKMTEIREVLKQHFKPVPGYSATYKINIENHTLYIEVTGSNLDFKDQIKDADLEATTSEQVMSAILEGTNTFQRAFMSGEIKMKGDFKVLRSLDQLFVF